MTELENYIQSYFGFSQSNELNTIGSLFKTQKIEKGEFLLKSGQNCDKLVFISSGIIRIYALHDGEEITQWISVKGGFVTDLASLIFDSPARWNIQALTNADLYVIHKEDYRKIGNIIPKWHELEKLFIAKCFIMLEDRVFGFLSLSAEERYHIFFENNKSLFNEVPLQFIASMLGMTPETFSRIRKKVKPEIS